MKDSIDIQETSLLRQGHQRERGELLNILLKNRSGRGNIIWATDSYKDEEPRSKYKSEKPILPELVTGDRNQLIQPRAVKSKEEQKRRTKDKAEVFTPLDIVGEMNKSIDWAVGTAPVTAENWQEYVCQLKLEITCGEAPFITSRYDPTKSRDEPIVLYDKKGKPKRVGFLDRKLYAIDKFCDKNNWLEWATKALQSSYGYEWQGDNLLIARENVLYTMFDFYQHKFKTTDLPPWEMRKEFANIISWNLWQMDGLKNIIPMSQHGGTKPPNSIKPKEPQIELGFLKNIEPDTSMQTEIFVCERCEKEGDEHHDGRYAYIKDWTRGGKNGRRVRFADLLG